MDVDNLEEDDGPWTHTGQTFVGTDPNGEEALFSLQRRGNSYRVAPKGKSKGKGKFGAQRKPPVKDKEPGGSSKWDPNGCKRCGRPDHWAGECYATKCIDGGKPREKPQKKRKGKGKGKGELNDMGEDEGGEDQYDNAGGEKWYY